MTDFENRQGEFIGWGEDRRRCLLNELFEAIAESPLILIGAAVVVADFNGLDVSTRRKLMDPWYVCYQSCFREVLSLHYFFDPVDEGVEPGLARIRACFYEQHRQYKYGPILFALAHDTTESRGLRRADGIIGWGGKDSSVHFQLADIIAYELRKHVENAIFQQGRPTRWPMKQLLKTILVANVFDSSGTSIPTDEGKFAIFRNGRLADIQRDGRIRVTAPEKRPIE